MKNEHVCVAAQYIRPCSVKGNTQSVRSLYMAGCVEVVLLPMSSHLIEVRFSHCAQGRKDLTCNVALDTTDHFRLGYTRRPEHHVRSGALIMTEPDDDHAIECGAGTAIATTIEPVTVVLSELRAQAESRPN